MTRWFDRRRGLAVAILTSGQGLAGAMWPGIVQYFNDLVGWRGTFLYFSVLAAMTMVPLALLLRPRPPLMAAGGTHGIRVDETQGLDLSPRVLQGLLWFGGVFCCAAMAIPIVHLVSHATDLGHTLEQGARILSVLFIAGFVSRIAFGMLADRIGGVRTLLIGSACMAVMLFVFVFTTSYAGLLAAALLFGLGFSGIMPCYPLLIRLFFPVGEGRLADRRAVPVLLLRDGPRGLGRRGRLRRCGQLHARARGGTRVQRAQLLPHRHHLRPRTPHAPRAGPRLNAAAASPIFLDGSLARGGDFVGIGVEGGNSARRAAREAAPSFLARKVHRCPHGDRKRNKGRNATRGRPGATSGQEFGGKNRGARPNGGEQDHVRDAPRERLGPSRRTRPTGEITWPNRR